MKQTLSLLVTIGLALVLTACGGGGGSSSPKAPTAMINLLSPAETTFSLKDGDVQIDLSATSSSSPREGASLTYRWELIQSPELSKAAFTNTNTETTSFSADLPGNYVVSLIVNDGIKDSAAARMTFTATSPFPIAVSDTIINVALGTDSVGLDGSKSTLPTGATGELQYQWTLLEKPQESGGALLNAEQSNATLSVDVAGEYKLQLVVTFEDMVSKPLNVVVTVFKGNVQPVAKAENVEALMGQKVTLDAGESYDEDNDNLQYRWRIEDAPFEPLPILNNWTTATPNFTPTVAGEYELKLFVFDGQRSSEEADVVVTVTPDPEVTENLPPVGELAATGYYPSNSVGEQEVGLRADFKFVGYDPEGEALQVISAELLEKPAGSASELIDNRYSKLGYKINTLDTTGIYRVRMVVSDGVNEVTKEATMEAKIGNVNNRPTTGSVDVDSKAVLVGQSLIFNAESRDKDADEIFYEWTLIDRPDGSNATIEAVIHPENGDYSRARVLTDVPGVYRVHLIVKDDRGLYSSYDREEFGYAKVKNEVPEIHSVVWQRNWGSLQPGENFYQILPCMSLSHKAVVVDPDGDEVFIHRELTNVPEGGDFTSSPDEADCPNTRGQVFTKPGTYVFRYYATDVLSDAPNYDFVVNVDPIEQAKGLRLRSINSDGESLWRPLPYKNTPDYGYVFSPKSDPIEESAIQWSMTAMDGDYTIEKVEVRHINGGLKKLEPKFIGLENDTVIKQGETLDFQTQFPAIPCIRTDDRFEGFHLSFSIKEIPEISFVYEDWHGPNSFLSTWRECEPGELD